MVTTMCAACGYSCYLMTVMGDQAVLKRITFPPETNSNDFGVFLELISRFEFEFCRCVIFLKDSNFWCVHVNVPWPVCAHAIPFRMLWLP